MNSLHIFLNGTFLSLVLCFMAGCRGTSTDTGGSGSEPMVLKTYSVPTEFRLEVSSIIKNILIKGEAQPLGKAIVTPSGEILVAAPKSFHPGIEEFVSGLSKATPTPPPTIRLDYWVVEGTPSSKEQQGEPIQELVDALATLSQSQGPMNFRLAERASLVSLSGERVKTMSPGLEVSQTATQYKDRVIADLELRFRGPNSLSVRVQIPNNKTMVIGQQSASPSNGNSEASAQTAIFYFIRAQAVEP